MRVESPPNKIEPIKEDFQKVFGSIEDQGKRENEDDEFSHLDSNVAQPRLSLPCFPESLRFTFTSAKLEKIYQRSNKRERLKSNLFCALSAIVANITLIVIHSLIRFEQHKRVIILNGVFLGIFAGLFLICLRQCSPGHNVSILVWVMAAVETLLQLGLGEYPLVPSDLVGVVTFLAFLAFILLPVRLRFCIFWVTILGIVHSLIVGLSADKLQSYSVNQVG